MPPTREESPYLSREQGSRSSKLSALIQENSPVNPTCPGPTFRVFPAMSVEFGLSRLLLPCSEAAESLAWGHCTITQPRSRQPGLWLAGTLAL